MIALENRLSRFKAVEWLRDSKFSPIQLDCSVWANEAKTLLYLVAFFGICVLARVAMLLTVFYIIVLIS